MKYFVLNFLVLPCMAVVYWAVNSQGLRLLAPVFATKLYRVPGAAAVGLAKLKFFHEIDVAPFFAFVLLVMGWFATTKAFRIIQGGEELWTSDAKTKVYCVIAFVGAAILVFFDAYLLHAGLAHMDLFSTESDMTSLYVTIGYSAVLVYAAFLHITP